MENGKFNEATEAYLKNLNTASQWVTDNTKVFMDNYSQHMELLSNSATTMFNSLLSVYSSQFNNGAPQKEIAGIFNTLYDQQAKLLAEFNRKFLNALTNLEGVETYHKMIQGFSESNKEILNSFNKQIDSLTNNNLGLWNEFMNKTYSTIKENAKFYQENIFDEFKQKENGKS